MRRARVENVPRYRAGPTRWGSSDGAFDTRIVYITKIVTSTSASNGVIECFNGRVSE